ncbi:MAG: TonB-dependent receptor [Acidobacteria bacterium]|nr:TonB-dependent receptor [Acidobacteriota bacterium]
MAKGRVFVLSLMLLVLASSAPAQRITGSITGQVTDPQGAVVRGAAVTIASQTTGYKLELTTNHVGSFIASDLRPAKYKVTVVAEGFANYTADVNVHVGAAVPLNASLQVGPRLTEVAVEATAATVDTSRHTVGGLISGDRIDDLPLNGRNFLDLAQLEPGVQVVDGTSIDVAKNQLVGVSIGGRSGRSTRIQVDGVDITDELVGTTVANLSNESIQEFQLSQSSLDPSTDLTSVGGVNIITRSGTNDVHGSGFLLSRDARFAADQRLDKTAPTPEKPPFDRQLFGGRAGGPWVKDKLFWHAEYEQSNQDSVRFTSVPEFPQFTGVFQAPVDEKLVGGRLDGNVTGRMHAFYRFTHNDNLGVTGFGGRELSAFSNRNNTNAHVLGMDISSGRWVHQVRFSYLNFNNFIEDANARAGTPATLAPGGEPVLIRIGRFSPILDDIGPDPLAPQSSFHDNKQAKYDAGFTLGSHTLRFGASYNKIDQAAFLSILGLAPRIRTTSYIDSLAFAATGPFAGGEQNPLNFPVNQIALGNGLANFSEKPALGFPFGGTTNHRLGFYIHDSWKAASKVTLNLGLRYNWNSAVSNSDLERTPLVGEFDPTLLGRPRRDINDFAPQVGFAWDVLGDGKTVVRGGAGVFYETNLFINYVSDRILNIPPGIFSEIALVNAGFPFLLDPATGGVLFDFSTMCSTPTGSCFGQPIGNVTADAVAAQRLFQEASAALATGYPQPGVPPVFDLSLSGDGLLDPNYHTPYAIQMNLGFQRELRPGLVLSADYVHNRGVRFNQARDRNRIGAADTLDVGSAQAAIAATLADFGCASMACVLGLGGSISDFAAHGLGAGSAVDGFAFRGENPNFRSMGVLQPMGLSRYQALQARLTGDAGNWGPFEKVRTNLTYSLSRYESTSADQDLGDSSGFNDQPTKFFGPALLDRTHQIGITFLVELPWGFQPGWVRRQESGGQGPWLLLARWGLDTTGQLGGQCPRGAPPNPA